MKNYNIRQILFSLDIGNDEFLKFLEGKVKSYPLQVEEFSWGCFPIINGENILVDIRVLVPNIIDEKTLLVNIHEYAHAFELYEKLYTKYEENIELSEKYACGKESAYLQLLKKKK
ncbi:MAG: hypothetical protein NC181_02400 [Clostridium sp.]|nr:hypothetical protein [Clostridium sp.]MCM1443735.1 hypothetical protein [Candidatus Amulumruptor caecigallinarius]